MSVRIEWLDAENTHMYTVSPGTTMPDDQHVNNDKHAIVISADNLIVIEGTKNQLRALLQNAKTLLSQM